MSVDPDSNFDQEAYDAFMRRQTLTAIEQTESDKCNALLAELEKSFGHLFGETHGDH